MTAAFISLRAHRALRELYNIRNEALNTFRRESLKA
jgi:hypothetical protein